MAVSGLLFQRVLVFGYFRTGFARIWLCGFRNESLLSLTSAACHSMCRLKN